VRADLPMNSVRLDLFNASRGFERGRSTLWACAWYGAKLVFFTTRFPWPSVLKRSLLRAFGARIGCGVVLKPNVNIHFPWKLTIGDFAWIGEESWILNFEPVIIGAHCCVSQRVFLCTGNHDFRDVAMSYRNAQITLEEGVWVAAQAFVGPGVTIGYGAVVLAGSTVVRSLGGNGIYQGVPARKVGVRWPAASVSGLEN
jgi:putative colanic acid biosynthesis acetyltransferase WcaF